MAVDLIIQGKRTESRETGTKVEHLASVPAVQRLFLCPISW